MTGPHRHDDPRSAPDGGRDTPREARHDPAYDPGRYEPGQWHDRGAAYDAWRYGTPGWPWWNDPYGRGGAYREPYFEPPFYPAYYPIPEGFYGGGRDGAAVMSALGDYAGGRTFGARDPGPGGPPDDGRGFFSRAADEVSSWFGDDAAERRREMDHRGRGPRNYQRSDSRIHEDVNDRLTEDDTLDATGISVQVKDREVTLDGTVASRYAKRRAEDCADSVSGVEHVQNNLRVQDPGRGAAA